MFDQQKLEMPPKIVSDGQNLLLDSMYAGDEPYMLASNLKNVAVLVDKDRVKSGLYAIKNYGTDVLILDEPTAVLTPQETEKLFTNVIPYMKAADYCFVNLECALTETDGKIKKFGPNLAAPLETAEVLKELGIKKNVRELSSRTFSVYLKMIKARLLLLPDKYAQDHRT